MTDSQVLAMGIGRRAPRSMKLVKPAPLKRSVSPTIKEGKVNTFQGVRAPRRSNLKKPIPRKEGTVRDAVIHEDNYIQRAGMTPNKAKRTMTDSQVLAMGVGRRATRSTKLEKPAPLKRSVSPTIKDISMCKSPAQNQPKNTENDIQRPGVTPNTAKRTADNLITSTLADLKDTETSNAAAVKPGLKSQVERIRMLYDRQFEHFNLLADPLLDLYETKLQRTKEYNWKWCDK